MFCIWVSIEISLILAGYSTYTNGKVIDWQFYLANFRLMGQPLVYLYGAIVSYMLYAELKRLYGLNGALDLPSNNNFPPGGPNMMNPYMSMRQQASSSSSSQQTHQSSSGGINHPTTIHSNSSNTTTATTSSSNSATRFQGRGYRLN